MSNGTKKYDCIVMGGGFAGCSFALLSAMKGKKVALFEYADKLGGYGSVSNIQGYNFCIGMQYFFETADGGIVDNFLKKNQLDQIKFTSLNKNGYDKIMTHDFNFDVPIGINNLKDKLIKVFPKKRKQLNTIFRIAEDLIFIRDKLRYERKSFFRVFLESPFKAMRFYKFLKMPAQVFFDKMGIDGNLRTIFLGHIGNIAPRQNSDLTVGGILIEMCIYTRSATYPTNGISYISKIFHQNIEKFGADIFLNTEIIKINNEKDLIKSVLDKNGNEYSANLYVSAMDPKLTFEILSNKNKLVYSRPTYPETTSFWTFFIGLKGIDITKFGFGNYNIWYIPTNDVINGISAATERHDFSNSWVFISTPSAHVAEGVVAPKGCHTMQIVIPADYKNIKTLYDENFEAYSQLKKNIENFFLNLISEKFIPNVREYIEVFELLSPLDIIQKVKSSAASMYGRVLTGDKFSDPIKSPFQNLVLIGQSTSFPGLGYALDTSQQVFDNCLKTGLLR